MRLALSAVFISALLVGGCSKKTAGPSSPGQQAVVTLKDGSGFAGKVTASSTSSITLAASNGETRTYPMNQVASVQYAASSDNGAAAPASTALPEPESSTPSATSSAASPATSAATSAPPPAPVSSAPAPAEPSGPVAVTITIPAGTRLTIRNNETIDSKSAAPGQTYGAVIARNVRDSRGRVAIPSGSDARLIVRGARSQGELQGRSELALDIDTVSVGGKRYRVDTANLVERGREGVGTNKRTAKFLGGGSALGALLGAVAGGGRGAAIGALSGAAAGTATQAVTRGHGVRVPAETLMTFRLESPIHIREIR